MQKALGIPLRSREAVYAELSGAGQGAGVFPLQLSQDGGGEGILYRAVGFIKIPQLFHCRKREKVKDDPLREPVDSRNQAGDPPKDKVSCCFLPAPPWEERAFGKV